MQNTEIFKTPFAGVYPHYISKAERNNYDFRRCIRIYPNPATDFIEFNGDLSTYSKANIYSLDEKLIRNQI